MLQFAADRAVWASRLGLLGRWRMVEKIKVEQHTFMGSLWLAGWLFTLGFLHLAFWKGILALVLWPYYLGVHFNTVWR
jgi:hypothetical protein